jgi:hypothetical protein
MQHTLSSAEVCDLLDRALQTSQSLNRAMRQLFPPILATPASPPSVPVLTTSVSPANEAKLGVLPIPPKPAAPVLTIKLADLLQAAERKRNHQPPPKRAPRSVPTYRRRPERFVEVVHRRSFKMVS